MTTEDLRALTAAACTRMAGKLWPNGIGFDKGNWEYRYVESRGAVQPWQAAYSSPGTSRSRDYGRYWGWGDTPELAHADAKRRKAAGEFR